MTLTRLTRLIVFFLMMAAMLPAESSAKPNSYPGENSKFDRKDPNAVAKWEAERAKRIEQRKQRREERRLKRLNQKTNRLN